MSAARGRATGAARTPFSTVLVANRGEIARRIFRTARSMGLGTVAVYSDADSGALHMREADRAVHIGPAPAARSYLDIDAIVGAARTAGADAVHPGYGFLAENAALAEACRREGIVFVGPPAEVIARMGDKAAAKAAMAEAGLPCLPGAGGGGEDGEALAAEAERIGYPVMIKALAGGGGRGMRLVAGPEGFGEALRAARAEATAAFGDGRVMLEKAVASPRHVEIQILCDRHGNAVHLGERDCSVQRRHQKLIEEAPSPAVSAELRARMGAAAVEAARAIGYEGAGTMEFLLDAEGGFHFMEMNTRLQVEHPVTEAITGLDLVALQFRIAAGEPLPFAQDEVRLAGHAIEARICAEDARLDFMPQSGVMERWSMPDGLRVEHALASGAPVPAHYDSMLARLIAHGDSREEARRRLLHGLAEAVALGVTTNIDFLSRCLEQPDFAAGAVSTGFVAEHLDALKGGDPAADDGIVMLAAVLLAASAMPACRAGRTRTLAPEFDVPMRIAMGETIRKVAVGRRRDGAFVARAGEAEAVLSIEEMSDGHVSFELAGVIERAALWRGRRRLAFRWRGRTVEVEDLTLAAEAAAVAAASDGSLRAAMAGMVAAVRVAPGDAVAAGQALVSLEAMKMEHVLSLPVGGTVAEVLVAEGDQVGVGQTLVRIDPAG